MPISLWPYSNSTYGPELGAGFGSACVFNSHITINSKSLCCNMRTVPEFDAKRVSHKCNFQNCQHGVFESKLAVYSVSGSITLRGAATPCVPWERTSYANRAQLRSKCQNRAKDACLADRWAKASEVIVGATPSHSAVVYRE